MCQCKVSKDNDGNYYANCDEFVKSCVPFYDAVILRSTDHVVDGENNRNNCGDKFYKAAGGNPYSRRMGDPCHGWGSTRDYSTKGESLVDKVVARTCSSGEISHAAALGRLNCFFRKVYQFLIPGRGKFRC